MNRAAVTACPLAIACFVLTACGPRLGEVRVSNVAVVGPTETPADLQRYASRNATPYLRLTLVSPVDLRSLRATSELVGGVCPWKHGDHRQVFGGIYEGGAGIVYRAAAPRPGSAFTYEAYVPVSGFTILEHRRDGVIEFTDGPAYDLIAARRDLCLELDAPGMLGGGGWSRPFVVPAAAIARAAQAKR